MSRIVFEEGDVVGYPRIEELNCERKMTVLDRNVIRYSTGKNYVQYLLDGLLEHLAEDMHKNIDNEFDNLVVISGREGSGKSNLAYHLCKLFDPEFSVEEGYIYEFPAFIKKLTEGGDDRGKIFWMDEATNIASNRDWMKGDNKTFIQMLEMMRSRGWTLVMCIPSLERLDVYIRDYRVRYLLIAKEMRWEGRTVVRRGYAELKIPKKNGYWFTLGYAEFPRMEPAEKELYEEVKRRHQDDKIAEIDERVNKKRTKDQYATDKRRIRTLTLKCYEMGMTYVEIAEMLGCNRDTVKDLLRQARAERNRPVEGDDEE